MFFSVNTRAQIHAKSRVPEDNQNISIHNFDDFLGSILVSCGREFHDLQRRERYFPKKSIPRASDFLIVQCGSLTRVTGAEKNLVV